MGKQGKSKIPCKTQHILAAGLVGGRGISWGYVGPSWGLGCPKLEAMLPHLGAMFAQLEAYVGPC